MKKVFLTLVLSLFLGSSINAKGKGDKFTTHCTITTYNPTKAQCNDDNLTTANGTKINTAKLKKKQVRYVAVSRDMLWCLPYGSRIHIEGLGEFEVVDTMHPRFNHYIDVMQHSSDKNFKLCNVKVTLLKKRH